MPNQYTTHHHRPSLISQVLAVLQEAGTPQHVFALCRTLKTNPAYLYGACGKLVQRGLVQRTAPGTYALPREG